MKRPTQSGRRLSDEGEYPAPLLAVAGHRLPGASRVFPEEPQEHQAWSDILAAAKVHRVTGLLDAAVRDGAMPATATQMDEARVAHRAALGRVLALERELVTVVKLLSAAGIEYRALKGSAVAHLDYPNPALRSFIDIDILVRARDIPHAVSLLFDAGFNRTLAEPRPGFDQRFDKGMTLIPAAANYELDLHRTFVLGPWSVRMDWDRLWNDEGEEFQLCGRPIKALSQHHRFMHACYHAALGNWPLRLGSLRDVAEMLRKVDGASIRSLAADWGAEAIVAAAVADSGRLLGIPPTDELSFWAQRYVPSRREVAWLNLHTHADKTFAAQALGTLRVLRWRDKAAYLRALLMPDARYTAGRHTSALRRFRYGIREIRRGWSPRS